MSLLIIIDISDFSTHKMARIDDTPLVAVKFENDLYIEGAAMIFANIILSTNGDADTRRSLYTMSTT